MESGDGLDFKSNNITNELTAPIFKFFPEMRNVSSSGHVNNMLLHSRVYMSCVVI